MSLLRGWRKQNRDALTFQSKKQVTTLLTTGGAGAPVPAGARAAVYARYIAVEDIADLSAPGDIDGHTLAEGDVVCLAGQTSATQNYLYVAAADGSLSRTTDIPFAGQSIRIIQGDEWAGREFVIANYGAIVIGTTEILIQPSGTTGIGVNGAAAAEGHYDIEAGDGITATAVGVSPWRNKVTIINDGVLSINGSVGAHTIQHSEVGGLSVSTSGSTTTIQNTGVTSLNGKNYAITISSTGSGIDVTSLSSTAIGITNTGVIAVNGITNTASVTIAAGTGIAVSTSGSTVTISNPGILTLNSLAGAVSIAGESGGIGVSASGATVTLTNLGVKKISATGGDVAGDVTFEGVGGLTVDRISSTLLRFGISLAGLGTVDFQDFSSDGEWVKPSGAQLVMPLVIAGGGGGASGGVNSTGSIRRGGGGGAAGARVMKIFAASVFGATADVSIGLGGAGGTGVTSGNGNSGSPGVETIFNFGGAVELTATGGANGIGEGAFAGGTGTLCFYEFVYVQAPNGGNPSSGSATATAPTDSYYLSAPGGGGGSISAGGTRYSASRGGKVNWTVGSGTVLIAGGDCGISEGANGSNGTTGTIGHAYQVSSGGGGGASGDDAGTVDGGDGGNGSDYGAGGGGGGAATTGATSGAGGNGADGYCLVITICG